MKKENDIKDRRRQYRVDAKGCQQAYLSWKGENSITGVKVKEKKRKKEKSLVFVIRADKNSSSSSRRGNLRAANQFQKSPSKKTRNLASRTSE